MLACELNKSAQGLPGKKDLEHELLRAPEKPCRSRRVHGRSEPGQDTEPRNLHGRSGSEFSLKNGRSKWSEGRNKELRAGMRSKYQQSDSDMSLMVWGWQAGLAKVA